MAAKKFGFGRFLGGFLLLLLAVGVIIAIFNHQRLMDWYFGANYAPSSEMATIRDSLELTSDGTFLFNALTPTLDQASEFNQVCRDGANETAVLGCYTGGKIHVYDVDDPEFDGVKEVTTAHELLHAVWGRMKSDERNNLQSALSEVLKSNHDPLSDELDAYDASAQGEELYVRAGTEIRDLPTSLNQHFAKYFKNRTKIVDFYDSYIAVFRETKAQAEALEQEITTLGGQIDSAINTYQKQASTLDSDIKEFNNCATETNCFKSQAEFQTERSALISRQQALDNQNAEINALINTYNAKIDAYNQNVTRSEELQSKINSTSSQHVNLR